LIRALLTSFVFALLLLATGCAKRDYVVLYTSQDQFYAEPILKHFTATTGIEVRPVFDTESAKTAALAHRLRAEKNNPQCDVFWSNEEMHTRFLVRDGIIVSNAVKTIGFRSREVVINTNLVSLTNAPASLLEITQEKWRGKVAVAYPLFGTTSAHFMALRQQWGDAQWRAWCEGLVANGAKIVDGNSVVVRLVGAGECAIGLTDSDDIRAGLRQKLPISSLPTFAEYFLIPNTVSVISGAPRPSAAERLANFLSDATTLQRLVDLGAIEGIEPPKDSTRLSIDWSKADLDGMNEVLRKIFLRS
jgi:iron(III) transport system substrate-binding protein